MGFVSVQHEELGQEDGVARTTMML